MIERVGSQASERRTEWSGGRNPLDLRSGRSRKSRSLRRAGRVIPPNPTRLARSHYCLHIHEKGRMTAPPISLHHHYSTTTSSPALVHTTFNHTSISASMSNMKMQPTYGHEFPASSPHSQAFNAQMSPWDSTPSPPVVCHRRQQQQISACSNGDAH